MGKLNLIFFSEKNWLRNCCSIFFRIHGTPCSSGSKIFLNTLFVVFSYKIYRTKSWSIVPISTSNCVASTFKLIKSKLIKFLGETTSIIDLLTITDRTLNVVFLRFRGFSFTITQRQKLKGVPRRRGHYWFNFLIDSKSKSKWSFYIIIWELHC